MAVIIAWELEMRRLLSIPLFLLPLQPRPALEATWLVEAQTPTLMVTGDTMSVDQFARIWSAASKTPMSCVPGCPRLSVPAMTKQQIHGLRVALRRFDVTWVRLEDE